ncbi:MAG: GNAT family N-acetyltransferase [Paenibacillus dendritiformis]|uniref:GNAT family N-acetyltransferase n=1 Tax=uncultured Paenibacillus sp. TaxID=227322 RepID=UPI0025CF7F87|nr:GNAT family N-acetyltransferase [uncultured Paenibacillus sp.]MDU5144004.1 GNAT family N-acetyltransferase [Paenibacillus dendritiformis]
MIPLAFERLDKLGEDDVEQAAHVFVHSYMDALTRVSSDPDVLIRLIRKSFIRKQFYAALWNHQVVGIMAYATRGARSRRFDKSELQRILGTWKGWLFYLSVAREFHALRRLTDEECFLEAVATAPEHRGQGIAAALLRHSIEQLPYRVFKLEVADTNVKARRLYERQGFTVFYTKKQWLLPKAYGFRARQFMKMERERAAFACPEEISGLRAEASADSAQTPLPPSI